MARRRAKPGWGGLNCGSRALASLLLSAVCLSALDPGHRATQYAHSSWSQRDGQVLGMVHAVTQSVDGRLWVGTEFGLFRFDGVAFSSEELPGTKQVMEQEIEALAPAKDGGLWIGTRSGLSYWKDQELKQYQASSGAGGPGVSSIVVDHTGTVWAGTAGFETGGLCRVQAGRLRCLSTDDGYEGRAVLAMAEDLSGALWVASVNGVYGWNAGDLRRYGQGTFSAIAPSGDGTVLVRSKDGLQELLDGRFVDYALEDAGAGPQARVLLTDHDGALWIGTTGQGLLHQYQGRTDRFTRADGLSGDTVLSLFEDREGNIWVATDRGLDRFRDLPVTTFSKREGLSVDTAGSVSAARKGGVWLGTTQGVNRVADGRITSYHVRDGLPTETVGSLIEDRFGTLWVDTERGLVFLQGGRFQRLDLPGGESIRAVAAAAEDRDGALWLSDLDLGLIRIEGKRIARVIPSSEFGGRRAWALAADRETGGLLLGFEQGGVARYADGRLQGEYATKGAVAEIQVDRDGTVWVATEGGLAQLREGRVTTLTMASGLPCERIHAMVEDTRRGLWLDTPCGLVRISRHELDAWSADPEVKIQPSVFGARDGMHLRATWSGYFRGAAKSTDGRLWFPEFDGVAVVDPEHLRRNELAPPVRIESVLVDQVAHTIQSGMDLPPISQGLEISFEAFSFVDPEQVRFKYKLEGYDEDWQDVGGRRRALYPSLPPHDYRFRVIAANNDGVWNNVGAAVDFSVAPTFYQTAWFRIGSGAGIVVLVWAVCRIRMRRLEAALSMRFEERLRERTRISRELHDTLLQNISGFALQLDGLTKVVTAPLSAKEHLRELRQEAESWLHEARELVWDLRTQASDRDDLAMVIGQIGQQLTEGKDIQFRIGVSGTRRNVQGDTQRNLLRIVQEAVRNAASHSNGTKIDVQLSYPSADRVRIQICDDGRGFDLEAASQKSGHMGLATMRERAQSIGADLQISTSPGRGSTFVIQSPTGLATEPSKS